MTPLRKGPLGDAGGELEDAVDDASDSSDCVSKSWSLVAKLVDLALDATPAAVVRMVDLAETAREVVGFTFTPAPDGVENATFLLLLPISGGSASLSWSSRAICCSIFLQMICLASSSFDACLLECLASIWLPAASSSISATSKSPS